MGDFFALAGQTFSSCGYSFLPVTFKKSSRAGVKPAPTLLLLKALSCLHIYIVTVWSRVRHSCESRNPKVIVIWMPAFAGMTDLDLCKVFKTLHDKYSSFCCRGADFGEEFDCPWP